MENIIEIKGKGLWKINGGSQATYRIAYGIGKLYRANEWKKMIFGTTSMFIIYELFSLTGLHGTFDNKDMVTLFISAGLTFLFFIH